MKIDVTEDGTIRLKEVFNSIMMETEDGKRFMICMRDSGLEIGLLDDLGHDIQNHIFFN